MRRLVAAPLLLLACQSLPGAQGYGAGAGGDGAAGAGGSPTPSPIGAGGEAGTPVEIPPLLAHDGGRLFRVESEPFGASAVGAFHLAGGSAPDDPISDIAIADDGRVYGAALAGRLYEIDPATAEVRPLRAMDAQGLNSLAFVHDAQGAEVLLGGTTNGDLLRIDPGSAAAVRVTTFASGFSGDIVEVAGAGILATLRADGAGDRLVRLDLDGGAQEVARLPETFVYGLASSEGRLFGFSATGAVLEIDPGTGDARAVVKASEDWWGAAAVR